MSERKNIDRLFQEKFKDFEANPPEETWSQIEARLEEKKKRRIIPIWWKFSGVAALLLLGFLIGKSVYSPAVSTENSVVTVPNLGQPNENLAQPSQPNNQLAPKTNMGGNPIVNQSDSAIAAQSEPNQKGGSDVNQSSVSSSANKKVNSEPNHSAIGIAHQQSSESTPLKSNRIYKNHKAPVPNAVLEKSANAIAQNNAKSDNSTLKNSTIINPQDHNNTTTNAVTANKTINLDDLKGDPNSNSKIVTTETKVNDTTKIASVATNALEELLKEKESKEKQSPKENRWQLTSNVAPVFFGSVTNGSPVDSKFENNPKEYNTSLSVGVGLSYAVNDKFSIRTGINKMSVDYNTNDVAFFVNLDNSSGIKTINPTVSGQSISVEDATVETQNLLPFENSFALKNEGYMNQKMGYYEVPLELTYALINKRFGLKVIGGVSTFFLNENNISLVSQNMHTDLGKANNLNDVHFSTNLGLGIKYTFLKSFEFHVEPTLKYQLNTFSDNSGNFKPYIFGLYSGISYNF